MTESSPRLPEADGSAGRVPLPSPIYGQSIAAEPIAAIFEAALAVMMCHVWFTDKLGIFHPTLGSPMDRSQLGSP